MKNATNGCILLSRELSLENARNFCDAMPKIEILMIHTSLSATSLAPEAFKQVNYDVVGNDVLSQGFTIRLSVPL